VLPVEQVAEELRDVLAVEDQMRAPGLDPPLVERPREHELARQRWELEIHPLGAPLDLHQEPVWLREMLDQVRGEDDVAPPLRDRQPHRVCDHDRRAVHHAERPVGFLERVLLQDQVRAPERAVAATDLHDKGIGLDVECTKHVSTRHLHAASSRTLLAILRRNPQPTHFSAPRSARSIAFTSTSSFPAAAARPRTVQEPELADPASAAPRKSDNTSGYIARASASCPGSRK